MTNSGDKPKAEKATNLHMKCLQSQQPELQLQFLTTQALWTKVKEEMINIDKSKIDSTNQKIPIDFVAAELQNECQGTPELSQLTISKDAATAMSKACELFILDLTLRSYQGIIDSNRHNLQAGDIRKAVETTDNYDLLLDAVADVSRDGDK